MARAARRLVVVLLSVVAMDAAASELPPFTQSGATLTSRARGIRIERFVAGERVPTTVSAMSNRAKQAWLRRLGTMALRQEGRLPDSLCHTACSSCTDQILINVSFAAKGKTHHLGLRPREGLAFLRGPTVAVWSFADSVRAVMALVREALPDDARVSAWTDQPLQPGPEPDSAAYRSDEVFVRDLPEAIHKVPPQYPEFARVSGISGQVHVEALVAPDGSVAQARVVKSVKHLDEAALVAVRQWRFSPARCGGRSIAVRVMVPVRFSLN